MTRLTPDQAGLMAVQGIFADADRMAAKRLGKQDRHVFAKVAEKRAAKRLRSVNDRM